MTFLWAKPGHYQKLVRIRWVFAGESNKETGSMGDGHFEMYTFLNESVLQVS